MRFEFGSLKIPPRMHHKKNFLRPGRLLTFGVVAGLTAKERRRAWG